MPKWNIKKKWSMSTISTNLIKDWWLKLFLSDGWSIGQGKSGR